MSIVPLTAFPVSAEQSTPETPQNESEELKLGILQLASLKRATGAHNASGAILRGRVEQLAECESQNGEHPAIKKDGYIIDTNGKKSWGVLQFQEETWKEFTQKYNLEHLDITDAKDQKELAYRMLSDNPRLYGRWKNCSEKLGFL